MTNKYDYEIKKEIVKVYAIMNKNNSVKNIINKTLINIPVIMDSENNQWYVVKYIK